LAEAESLPEPLVSSEPNVIASPKRPQGRLIFRYSKRGIASYLQHLSIVDAFERAFMIAGLDVAYSEGFNPMPRFETAQPLSIAVESSSEIGSLLLYSAVEPSVFAAAVNSCLPAGLRVEEAAYFGITEGKKQRTIGSLEWGSEYQIRDAGSEATARLAGALQEFVASQAVPDALVRHAAEEGFIRLRLRLPLSKDHGLLRILEACTERRPVQAALQITRSSIYADEATASSDPSSTLTQ